MPISLWEFASGCYQRAGVAEVCLALQDNADADINMLLAAAWLAADARHWQTEDVEELTQACRRWRTTCLLPLRQIRRNLKGLASADNWYQRIKALELEAERYQLRLIEDSVLPAEHADIAVDTAAALIANLNVYLPTLPALANGGCRSEVELLTQLLTQALNAPGPLPA